MLTRLLRRCGHMDKHDKLVAVVSWWPSLDKYGIAWPTLRMDRLGRRKTVTPIWQIRKSN